MCVCVGGGGGGGGEWMCSLVGWRAVEKADNLKRTWETRLHLLQLLGSV